MKEWEVRKKGQKILVISPWNKTYWHSFFSLHWVKCLGVFFCYSTSQYYSSTSSSLFIGLSSSTTQVSKGNGTIIYSYYLLTESEVITGKSQTEALMYWPSDSKVNTVKAEVWDFPVMTERTRLISYLLYGLFSAILRKNTIKTPEVIFHIHLHVLRLSSSPILKKYLYAVFSFSY